MAKPLKAVCGGSREGSRRVTDFFITLQQFMKSETIAIRRGKTRTTPLWTPKEGFARHLWRPQRYKAIAISDWSRQPKSRLARGHPMRAKKLLAEASALKRRFNERFWMPERQFYALALDHEGKTIDAIASNIGHCLGANLIDRDKIGIVVRRLMSPEMFSGWGIRTLSTDNPGYDPFSYHRGSVWPVENSTIAAGFAICGYINEAIEVIGSQLALATLYPNLRLPEVVSGHERNDEYPAPGLYPQANLFQSWSVSAISLYLQILIGLRAFAPIRTLFVKPVLPEWLPWVELHGLRVG